MLIQSTMPGQQRLAPTTTPTPTAPAGPTDAFVPDTAEKSVIFPALNAMVLDQIFFDVDLLGLGEASLTSQLHLSNGSANGDVSYDLPLNTNTMQGKGKIDGQDFQEKWVFGNQLTIDGSLGKTQEHLSLSVDQKGWQVRGQIGKLTVDEEVVDWETNKGQGFIVNGTVGDQKVHEEYTKTHADTNGTWQASMKGDNQASATGSFQTLKDRHRFTAQGASNGVNWTAGGDLIFHPNPNAPPPDTK